MKDIKDYLHLYIGCELYIFPAETVSDGWLKRVLKEYPDMNYKIPITYESVINRHGYLPILRKLSDMTELEQDESGIYYLKNGQWTPPQIIFLLKNGFDIFGLIESGLAIDKTTL